MKPMQKFYNNQQFFKKTKQESQNKSQEPQ